MSSSARSKAGESTRLPKSAPLAGSTSAPCRVPSDCVYEASTAVLQYPPAHPGVRPRQLPTYVVPLISLPLKKLATSE